MRRASYRFCVFILFVILPTLIVLPGQAQMNVLTPEEHCADAAPRVLETRSYEEAEWVLQEEIDYRVILCTAAGAIYLDLYEDVTPLTVNNFVFLAQNGFYDGTTFHRVLENFMAQGGDPTGTGRGGPGYQFDDEFEGFLTFDRAGLLAMANANNPERGIFGTNGSQFFITFTETGWLNHRHTIFGEVLTGMEAVRGLRLCDPASCSEGDALIRAHIITDPARVDADIPTRAAPDPEEVPVEIENFFRERNITDIEYGAGYLTTEEMRATAIRADDTALLDYLSDYGVEYRIESGFETCVPNYAPLRAMRSALMSFPSEDDAQLALDDDYWRQTEVGELERSDLAESIIMPGAVFLGDSGLCDDGRTRRAWMMYRYGRVLMRIEVSYAWEEGETDPALRWLNNSKFFFEPFYSEIIRDGLWGN